MKTKIIFLILTSINSLGYAQNKVNTLQIPYSSSHFKGKDSYAITNTKTEETLLFIEDYKKVHAYLLDKNLQAKDSLIIPEIPSKYKIMKGYTIDNKTYRIILSNEKSTKFLALHISFDRKKCFVAKMPFKLKKESLIHCVSHNNLFYVITVSKRSSDINFYKFDEKLYISKTTRSFKSLEHKGINGFPLKAYDILIRDSSPFQPTVNIPKLEDGTPQSLETTSKPTKLFIQKNKFVFSFDDQKHKTHLFFIDPETFEVTEKQIDKPIITNEDGSNSSHSKHNSFLKDDKLFQLAANSKKMIFSIKNIYSGEILKEISLNKKDTISFKNAPIFYEGIGLFGMKNEHYTEKTSKYLSKISSSKIGIVVDKNKGLYKITLGGFKEIQSGGAPMMGMPGIPMGSIGAVSISFNPTFAAYGGYTNTKSTYIECVFNENFEHQKIAVPTNAFDKIKSFEKNIKKRVNNKVDNNIKKPGSKSYLPSTVLHLKNIFKINDRYYFGYLKKNKTNSFRQYEIYEFLN